MMKKPAVPLFLAILMVGGCGGEPDVAADAAPAEPAPVSVEREPLTEADLAGLDLAELQVEIPWTQNMVRRSADPVAPRSMVESAEVSSHEDFDRAIFTFSSDAPPPGYEMLLVPPGAAVLCGDAEEDADGAPAEHAPELEGNVFLVLRLSPALVSERGRTTLPVAVERHELPRIHEAGVTCAEERTVTWVAGLVEGDELRVLQMRDPRRLVVDIR